MLRPAKAQLIGLESWRKKLTQPSRRFFPKVGGSVSGQDKETRTFLNLPGATQKVTPLKVVRGKAGAPQIDFLADNVSAVRTFVEEASLDEYYRILFLGTSQFYGLGANRIEQRVAAVFQQLLANAFPKAKFLVVNASARGSRVIPLIKRYDKHLHLFRPQMVVVNLSTNDHHLATFKRGLETIVTRAHAAKARLFFFQEAVSRELRGGRPFGAKNDIHSKHKVMSKVGRAHNIPVYDLHGHILQQEEEDTGLFWWDCFHMTSHGQRVVAEFIREKILPVLQNEIFAQGRTHTQEKGTVAPE
jgi:lysophospholipase L1-like esterase